MKILLPIFMLLLSWQLSVSQSYSDIANEKSGAFDLDKPSIVGLWKVDKVSVGNEERTPTARWFQFKPNGTYEGGNGGVRNGNGTYSYDTDNQELWQAINGEADPYGPFKIIIENETMNWTRLEDDMKVTVSLSKTNDKPLAPWDLIVGNWTIQKAEGYDIESDKLKSEYMLDPERYYLGWDRRYRKFDKDNNRIETGIWHIEAHSNWLWTISDKDNIKTGYALEIKNNQMTWTKDGEKEKLKILFKKN